ncbi:MAG: methyltransferase domain-containing protein [Thermoprotei archaeon]
MRFGLDQDEFFRMLMSEERKKWQNPGDILSKLGLSRGHRFLDVASGPGYFATEASKIVGESGYVYCVDADQRAADICFQNLSRIGYRNFKVVTRRIEDVQLPTAHFNVALVANVLHDFEDPVFVMRRIYTSLCAEGILGVVDWKKIETPFGPPLSVRLDEGECVRIVEEGGFKAIEVDTSYPYHYLIKAKKTGYI